MGVRVGHPHTQYVPFFVEESTLRSIMTNPCLVLAGITPYTTTTLL